MTSVTQARDRPQKDAASDGQRLVTYLSVMGVAQGRVK